MKKLYKEQKHSLYDIQKRIGVSKVTLYNYANKKRNIDKMPVEMMLAIASYEEIKAGDLIKRIKEYLK